MLSTVFEFRCMITYVLDFLATGIQTYRLASTTSLPSIFVTFYSSQLDSSPVIRLYSSSWYIDFRPYPCQPLYLIGLLSRRIPIKYYLTNSRISSKRCIIVHMLYYMLGSKVTRTRVCRFRRVRIGFNQIPVPFISDYKEG